MLAAAKMILHSHRLATKQSCLASTGRLTVYPGSTNTVPGNVTFSLDIRAGEDDRLMMLEDKLKVDFEKIANNEAVDDLNESGTTGKGCTVEWILDAESEAIKFNEDCIRCVDESARDLFGDEHEELTQAMISGAGQYENPQPQMLLDVFGTPGVPLMSPIPVNKEQMLTGIWVSDSVSCSKVAPTS